MTTVIYIAPASGDTHHPQCRIYRIKFATSLVDVDMICHHYRNHPERYTEVGLMNSQGRLVSFDGTRQQLDDLTNAQPLAAGVVFTYENTGAQP